MTTILKAAQELDREGGMVTPPMAPPEPARKPQLLRIAVLLLALIAGGLGLVLVLVLAGRQTPPAPAVSEPAMPERARPEVPLATPGSVGQTLPAAAAAPRPRVEKRVPASPAAATRPATAPQARGSKQRHPSTQHQAPERSAAEPRDEGAEEPGELGGGGTEERGSRGSEEPRGAEEPRGREAEGRRGSASDIVAPAPALPHSSESVSVPGEPGLQVKSLVYSANVHQRSVALQLAGGRGVNLHEGESSGGVEVQLILPNVVYLRTGGSIIAVNVPPRGRD